MNRRYILALPLLVLILACGPAELQKVAQGLNALAVATGTAQTTIIQMEQQKLIDIDTARTILEVFQKCNLAQKQAISITRALTQIDKPTQQQLVAIMGPITASIRELVENGTAGIKNEQTKQKVLAILVSVQSVITAINLSLGG
jgi:hypothetical protein